MSKSRATAVGDCLQGRYRLEQQLSVAVGRAQAGQAAAQQLAARPQGALWRAIDQQAPDQVFAARQFAAAAAKTRFRDLWPSLELALHPQIPRFSGLVEEPDSLWLLREWQQGSTLAEIQKQRAERQLVFGSGEVLLLLRQMLPPLAVLHGQGLVHGDLNPTNLLRRDQDCLPILLDFGLLQRQGQAPLGGATAGYCPMAQGRGEPAAAWMDLHALGVSALTLLSGRGPELMLSSDAQSWQLPEALDLDSGYRAVLERLLSEEPTHRFEQVADALQALQAVTMPQATGPVPRADRTVVLAPAAVVNPSRPAASPDLPAISSKPVAHSDGPDPQSKRKLRSVEREQAAEGRLWPVVGALLFSAVAGTAIGWFLLSRGAQIDQIPSTARDVIGRAPAISLPPAEVDQRQQLLSRLRALQVDRSWFLQLVDSSLLSRFPERGGRLPSDALEDAPLRRVWNDLAEEWLARIEQLPPQLRARLGHLKDSDWRAQRQDLIKQRVNDRVVEQLVSAGAQHLLPGSGQGRKPPEPYLQLWYAAALRSLADVQIERVKAQPASPTVLSSRVAAGGARLISIQVPQGRRLVLGINGTPLMQMTLFGGDGEVVAERGPLRVVTLDADAGSPVQVLVTNEGVASGLLTLSCRADLPAPQPIAAPEAELIPDSATGATGRFDAHPAAEDGKAASEHGEAVEDEAVPLEESANYSEDKPQIRPAAPAPAEVVSPQSPAD